MPTYDYWCQECDYEFEKFQSITAEALTKCPKCGKNALKRLIGPGSALIFRGSGFYCTDYRKASPPAGSATTGASGSGGDSKSASNDKGKGSDGAKTD